MHHVAQLRGREHLDLIAPNIKMPAHFKVTGGREAHNKGSVRLILEHLAGVELKAPRMRRRLKAEPPDDLAELFLVLKHAKGAIGEGLQIKVSIALERFL